MKRIATIGFGEAARAFVAGWRETVDVAVSTFDIKIRNEGEAERLRDAANKLDVACAEDPQRATAEAACVFSLVTADRAFEAAEETAAFLPEASLFLDCNSCAPQTKERASRIVSEAGGQYVDVAIMAPVHPKRHETPLLVSGPHAEAAKNALESLGMKPSIAGERIGQASTIKMLRSIMVKGMEALTAECALAARRAGVEDAVFASLAASDPRTDWPARVAYNTERMLNHGVRRAAEMEAVVETLDDLGMPSRMSSACAAWQAELGDLGIEADVDDVHELLDRILEARFDGLSRSS
ncbi:NAD(P)-dependent oxidoreductase [Pararhizobium mangrovi]|uniref:NAD(P)-dependent oxidoreductase n=1 Tax=Pararhizobium mangrovi TaxID=2590452 RepID=A0A506TXD3_9HYPH|nr:DUF1932 domain-containing protein [Pararhizobium mangrovi]TPW26702.1 NAD(P)-dependent oxidoreductase [Pararhizobium mangrovi]